jgi:hypothetical protein
MVGQQFEFFEDFRTFDCNFFMILSLSSSDIQSAGHARHALPPPEQQTISLSSDLSVFTKSRIKLEASYRQWFFKMTHFDESPVEMYR